MSDRKITAAGPGWRMPGKAKSNGIKDSMPNLLNAMGDSIERANKMDFGAPGVHTQNAFQQPFEQQLPGAIWVLLTESLSTGTYEDPASAQAKILFPDQSLGEQSLKEGADEIVVWNHSSGFSAASGDWILVIPFNRGYVAVPASGGSGGTQVIDFEVTDYCPAVPAGLSQSVYAVVTRVSCNATVQVGDEVIIHDPDMCWFNLPVDLLPGLRGTATLMDNDGTFTLVCAVAPDPSECVWIVKGLCCVEEEYSAP